MNKHFLFTEDSYWDDPGCDCCDAILMVCYNSEQTDGRLGSAHCLEDCYAQALITHIGYDKIVGEDDRCGFYYLRVEELQRLCKEHKITVEIIHDPSLRY